MADEPNAAGGGSFSAQLSGKSSGRGKNKVFSGNMTGSMSLEIPGIQQVSKDLASVTRSLQDLKSTLQGMSSAFTSGPIVNMLAQISRSATTTAQSLNGLTSAVAGASRGGGGGGGGSRGGGGSGPSAPAGGSGGGGAGYYNSLTASAGSRNTAASTEGANLGSVVGGGINAASSKLIESIPIVGGLAGGLMEFAGDLAMFPLRFARERVNKNRGAAYTMSGDLTPYQFSTGRSTASLMSSLKNIPGNMKGDVNDVLDALNIGRKSGAAYNFGDMSKDAEGYGKGGVRGTEFYNAVAQFQTITPGLGAGKVAQAVGRQLSNTQSNQAAAFYTGGAFSMIAGGGKMKSASAWAEGILKWLENQRPGSDRGKSFGYGALLAQQFPGSNINAWFDTVGISEEMKDYWWSWALAKTQMGVSGDKVFASMEANLASNQSWRKASADTVLTKNEFGLAGQMTGQYATRERSNQWYNQAMGAAVNRVIPGMASGPLRMMQYMPDQVDQFLWNTLESAGPLAQIVGGGLGWNAMAVGAGMGVAGGLGMPSLGGLGGTGGGFSTGPSDAAGSTPTGDLGDYGAYGSTSTAGLNPDLKAKVARMMKANPKLSITSGLRDKYSSAKLKRKGVGNFGSGTPFMGDLGDGGVNRHSPHSAGWAADMGPRSQYGWIQKNAHKFGLQTAAQHGEPWHVQNAGTISGGGGPMGRGRVGDPGSDVGDWNDWIPGSGIVGGIADVAGGVMDGIGMLAKILGTVFSAVGAMKDMAMGGGFLDVSNAGPDKVVGKVSQFMDLMGMGGAATSAPDQVIGYDTKFVDGLSSNISMNGSYQGDAARNGALAPPTAGVSSGLFAQGPYGDPGVFSVVKPQLGDTGNYQSSGNGSVRAFQFNNTFHISGGTGPTGGIDIGRIVPIMADRLEEEMKKRLAVHR